MVDPEAGVLVLVVVRMVDGDEVVVGVVVVEVVVEVLVAVLVVELVPTVAVLVEEATETGDPEQTSPVSRML